MEIVRNPGNFAKLLNELLVPFDAYASERGITIERRFRLPSCEIMYDEDAMHKVIVNLIGNALKFTPKEDKLPSMPPSARKSRKSYSSVFGIQDQDFPKKR